MFAIGDVVWSGISKLTEEAGEVLQIIGKLMGSRGRNEHWNVGDLKNALEDEIADLMAACQFVIEKNDLDSKKISARIAFKLDRFRRWHEEDPE